jgi:hypothetical protein
VGAGGKGEGGGRTAEEDYEGKVREGGQSRCNIDVGGAVVEINDKGFKIGCD